jgi:hypothetical protein
MLCSSNLLAVLTLSSLQAQAELNLKINIKKKKKKGGGGGTQEGKCQRKKHHIQPAGRSEGKESVGREK